MNLKSVPTQQELWLEQLARLNFWSFSLDELEKLSFRSFFAEDRELYSKYFFLSAHT